MNTRPATTAARHNTALLGVALALMLALSACDTVGVEPVSDALFPLAEGNAWTYESDRGPLTITVGPEAAVDGEPYFTLDIVQDGPGGVRSTTEYARAVGSDGTPSEGGLGVELLYTDGPDGSFREWTAFRYPFEDGAYVDRGRTYAVERERVAVPAGTFDTVTYSGYDATPEVEASLVPGVGIVRLADGQTVYELVNADLR